MTCSVWDPISIFIIAVVAGPCIGAFLAAVIALLLYRLINAACRWTLAQSAWCCIAVAVTAALTISTPLAWLSYELIINCGDVDQQTFSTPLQIASTALLATLSVLLFAADTGRAADLPGRLHIVVDKNEGFEMVCALPRRRFLHSIGARLILLPITLVFSWSCPAAVVEQRPSMIAAAAASGALIIWSCFMALLLFAPRRKAETQQQRNFGFIATAFYISCIVAPGFLMILEESIEKLPWLIGGLMATTYTIWLKFNQMPKLCTIAALIFLIAVPIILDSAMKNSHWYGDDADLSVQIAWFFFTCTASSIMLIALLLGHTNKGVAISIFARWLRMSESRAAVEQLYAKAVLTQHDVAEEEEGRAAILQILCDAVVARAIALHRAHLASCRRAVPPIIIIFIAPALSMLHLPTLRDNIIAFPIAAAAAVVGFEAIVWIFVVARTRGFWTRRRPLTMPDKVGVARKDVTNARPTYAALYEREFGVLSAAISSWRVSKVSLCFSAFTSAVQPLTIDK